jgi:hypothetical protein
VRQNEWGFFQSIFLCFCSSPTWTFIVWRSLAHNTTHIDLWQFEGSGKIASLSLKHRSRQPTKLSLMRNDFHNATKRKRGFLNYSHIKYHKYQLEALGNIILYAIHISYAILYPHNQQIFTPHTLQSWQICVRVRLNVVTLWCV